VRLRHDLQAAQQKIAGLLAQVARYEKRSARMQDAADRYKDEAEKALELARRFARADRIECERSA
jgi:phage shock protein A